MKKSFLKEIKSKTLPELYKIREELKVELTKIHLLHQAGKLKDTMLPVKKRKEWAQLLTVIREKELSEK